MAPNSRRVRWPPPGAANNSGHVSPADRPSSPASAASWSKTNCRSSWAARTAATGSPGCRENDYKSGLLAELRNPDYAAGYVSAAAAESWETFLLALRDVADAQSEMAKLASEAGVDRVNLYRMLSGKGNPRFKNLNLILKALGLRIAAVPDSDESDIQETPPETAGADRHR